MQRRYLDDDANLLEDKPSAVVLHAAAAETERGIYSNFFVSVPFSPVAQNAIKHSFNEFIAAN